MAKRRATDQITKDGAFARDDSASSDEDSSVSGVQKAGADVMARRKIAVPRSRLAKPPTDVPAARPASSPSPFAALSQPAPQAAKPSAPSSANASNPFAFLSSNSSSSGPRPNSSSSSVFPASSGSANTSAAGTHTSQELKLRGLNSSFAAKVAKADANSPFADWSHMCEKYLEYAKTIAAGTAASPAPATAPAAAPVQAKAKPEAKPEAKLETKPSSGLTPGGFKFSAGPTSGATSFQFGDKKIDIKDSAPPAKPAGGFVFNAGGKGEIRTAGAPAAEKEKSEKEEKPQFTFGKSDDSGEKSDASSAKPQFTFGKSSTHEAVKPAFSFGAAKDADSSKPAFSFGASKEKDSPKPGFAFNAAKGSEPEQSEAPKPAFSFGASKEADAVSSKPAFSFGASKDTAAASPKPAFSFGATQTDAAKPAFAFGKPAADDAAAKSDSKPVFSFGAPKDAGDSKPAFSFGAASSPAGTDSKPAFSFGAKSDAKPSFSFGAAKPDGAKPVFTFGNSSSNGGSAGSDGGSGSGSSPAHKSSLSFGTGVNPFGATQNDATWKPGSAVNIVSAESASATPGAGDQAAEGGEPSGEPSDEPADEQTDLGGPGPGEENEEAVYEKKAKLFELANGEYKTLGLGMLRVLVHKDTKKARALLRAEGSGRVLLNVALRKEFSYTVVGKGQVKLLDVKSGTDAPTVYLLRVKTEEDGNALKDKLEEVKN